MLLLRLLLALLLLPWRILKSLLWTEELSVGGLKRHAEWPRVRAEHLAKHSACAACGCRERKRLEVHHVEPVDRRRDLELNPTNLLTLCEHPARNCHLNVGHLGRWDCWNPNVREDAPLWLKKRTERLCD